MDAKRPHALLMPLDLRFEDSPNPSDSSIEPPNYMTHPSTHIELFCLNNNEHDIRVRTTARSYASAPSVGSWKKLKNTSTNVLTTAQWRSASETTMKDSG